MTVREQLLDRQQRLVAHPEHDYRVGDELAWVDEALLHLDAAAQPLPPLTERELDEMHAEHIVEEVAA